MGGGAEHGSGWPGLYRGDKQYESSLLEVWFLPSEETKTLARDELQVSGDLGLQCLEC